MKKEYKALEVEVVDFSAEDVITASGGGCPKDCAAVLTPCPHAICECNKAMECFHEAPCPFAICEYGCVVA